MGERTAIEWAHHTFNPWVGCTRVSPACDNCYAEAWSRRAGQPHLWRGERRRTSESNWHQPIKWSVAAFIAGERRRVFCGSLMDFADNQVPTRWRDDAWRLIDRCDELDWMILSKRPQNYIKMLPDWGTGWPHVWLGTTVEDRKRLINVDYLRNVQARIRFLSIEPLLEDLGTLDLTGIHLVIVGGESGPNARPMHPAWVRSIRDQCAAAGVAFFFKQWGQFTPSGDHLMEDRPEFLKLRGGSHVHVFDDMTVMASVGKKAAGRLLDGREHSAMPEPRQCV